MSDLQDALDNAEFFPVGEEAYNRTENAWIVDVVIVDAARRWAAAQEAITNEGPQPRLHRQIMRRHKKEWPLLWAALSITTEDLEQVGTETRYVAEVLAQFRAQRTTNETKDNSLD